MVNLSDIKKYETVEKPELRILIGMLETENFLLKQQIETLKNERNQFIRKLTEMNIPEQKSPSQPLPQRPPQMQRPMMPPPIQQGQRPPQQRPDGIPVQR